MRPHQVHGVNKSTLVFVVGQNLAQVRDVAGGEAQRVQLGQLGVRRDPGQRRLEAREGLGQHAHPSSLPRVGRVPLHLLALLLRATFGRALPGRGAPALLGAGRPVLPPPPPPPPPPVLRGARALAVGALLRALVGVLAELEDAVQELVVDVAEGAGGHGGAGSEHGLGRARRHAPAAH